MYFYARVDNVDQIPKEVILAVNMQGIFVVDQDTKEIVTEYSFKQMLKWGNSNVALMVIVDQHPISPRVSTRLFADGFRGSAHPCLPDMRVSQMYFKTDAGKTINFLIRDYMEWFLGAAITALRPIDEISPRPNAGTPQQSQQIEFKLDTVQQRALHDAFFGDDEETDFEPDPSFRRRPSHRRPRHARTLSIEDLRGLEV